MEAAVEKNVAGGNFGPTEVITSNILPCATLTVTPLIGFPKTITIDFGTSCTSPNGITRKGIIRVVISDSVRKTGSTAVMTFDNYFVNNFKVKEQSPGQIPAHKAPEAGPV